MRKLTLYPGMDALDPHARRALQRLQVDASAVRPRTSPRGQVGTEAQQAQCGYRPQLLQGHPRRFCCNPRELCRSPGLVAHPEVGYLQP